MANGTLELKKYLKLNEINPRVLDDVVEKDYSRIVDLTAKISQLAQKTTLERYFSLGFS